MSRRLSFLVLALFLFPILLLVLAGALALWEMGWLLWLWWIVPVCWGGAYLLARRTGAFHLPAIAGTGTIPGHWTERDRQAWLLVEAMVKKGAQTGSNLLTDPNYYVGVAEALLLEITRFYNPKAKDPLGPLTVTELLAAAQLAIEDITELVDVYVPGSRFLTVARWRTLTRVPGWYQTASNLWYVVSVLFGPASAASRYFVSKLVLGPAMQLMQENLLLWFYTSYVNRVGLYAIELNSGRLAVGARRWRELVEREQESDGAPAPAAAKPVPVHELTISLIGQVKAGKSSLINALLGRQEAASDVLPTTERVTRHELHGAEWLDTLVLQDTPGYGQADSERALEETTQIVVGSDLVLLVMDVLAAARDIDRQALVRMREWFERDPQLRRPRVIGVLTHIDSLSPVMEWEPPYDGWQAETPTKSKEKSIREAVQYVRETLAPYVEEVVPVCSDVLGNRVYGVEEWLIPAILTRLDEARAVLLLRTLHREGKRRDITRTLRQIKNASTSMLRGILRLD